MPCQRTGPPSHPLRVTYWTRPKDMFASCFVCLRDQAARLCLPVCPSQVWAAAGRPRSCLIMAERKNSPAL